MKVEIEHRPDEQRFVAEVEGRTSFLRYVPVDESTLDFATTWVHPELRGRRIGEQLVRRGLEYARDEGYRVVPSCWFVGTVLRRARQYEDLLVQR